FAEEGASVAIVDLDEAAASEAAGRLPLVDGAKAAGIGADVSNGDSVEAAVTRVVEELGGMNLYFVHADGHIVTPGTGTILEGITRASIIELAQKAGHRVEERRFSIDEWRDGVASGEITEIFACGTAAVVTPVGELLWDGGSVPSVPAGTVAEQLRAQLVDIQFGRAEDSFGWMHRIV
ncbi:SDR family oxidoreductase, partial [Nocardioides sp.]|uniref:SDR family oxidoreductase n=1 Tax=Nocardioides sp. TaxID=35761 RepID=UPI002B266764